MKIFFYLVLSILILVSCSKEDAVPTIDVSKLTKKWYPEAEIFLGETFPYEGHEECGKDFIEFFADGTYVDVDIFNCEASIGRSTWDLNGDNLNLNNPDLYDGMRITKLTDTVLEITGLADYENTVVPIVFRYSNE
jgi:hypothetical protein